MRLAEVHKSSGATVAPDGIPLYYTELQTEYDAALHQTILLDRSHEGRVSLSGADRFELVHRMSTIDMHNMAQGEGRPTLFTNANARIIERAIAYNRDDLLLMGGPGRAEPLKNYLQRNIFFRDDVVLRDITPETAQFALHGITADRIAGELYAKAVDVPALHGVEITVMDAPVFLARRKSYSGTHWMLVMRQEHAETVWNAVLNAGKPHGLIVAGSLTFNTLRIRAGRPAMGRELSLEYIPLEVGIWDEVSFTKGCYTGQEILARMESRNRLAKTLVRLELSAYIDAPAELTINGKSAGTITSSVQAPDGEIFAIGIVKIAHAEPDVILNAGTVNARVVELLGIQPANID